MKVAKKQLNTKNNTAPEAILEKRSLKEYITSTATVGSVRTTD